MNRKPIWIDCDTGVDDTFAILTALGLEELEILGVSAVVGNTHLEQGYKNSRDVLSLGGREDIKVYKGAETPLVRPAADASYFHGKNGVGDVELKPSNAPVEEKLAWDAMYETFKASKEKVTVCTIGPLTNMAIAIAKYPDIVDYIKEINMMGGAAIGGNVTPSAEFNIYHDPEAAENVFKSGIHVNMFGLDVTRKAYLTLEDLDEIGAMDNAPAKAARAIVNLPLSFLEHDNRQKNICLHDSTPIIYAAHPEFFEGRDCGVFVETQGKITTGKTCTDIWTDYKYEDRHCTVFLEVNKDEVVNLTKKIFGNY